MKYKLAILLLLALTTPAFSQQYVSHVRIPIPTGHEVPSDPELENLVWNKWDTKNFIIMSIDMEQGRYLFENIEFIKSWAITRWGLSDIDYSTKCKVMGVPNKSLMKKLFGLETSQAEVRVKDGRVEECVIWLLLEGKPAETIPQALTIINMNQYRIRTGRPVAPWVVRGMVVLNGTVPQAKGRLAALRQPLQQDSEMFFSQKMFSITEDEYLKLDVNQRRLFDNQAAAMVLLVRKEFGQQKFLQFMGSSDFRNVLGFRDNSQLDATYKRYITNLSNDLLQNETPDKYIQITTNQ